MRVAAKTLAEQTFQQFLAHPSKRQRYLSVNHQRLRHSAASSCSSDRCWWGAGCRSGQMTVTSRDSSGLTGTAGLCCVYRGVTARDQSGTRNVQHSSEPGPNIKVCSSKARFPLPELTARVNGPSWRVTGFHYPSTRAVLTGARFH